MTFCVLVGLIVLYISKKDKKITKQFLGVIKQFVCYFYKFAMFDIIIIAVLQFIIYIYYDWFDLSILELIMQLIINIGIIWKIQLTYSKSEKVNWRSEVYSAIYINYDALNIFTVLYFQINLWKNRFIELLSSSSPEFNHELEKLNTVFRNNKSYNLYNKIIQSTNNFILMIIIFTSIASFVLSGPTQVIRSIIYYSLLFVLIHAICYKKRLNNNFTIKNNIINVHYFEINNKSKIKITLKLLICNDILPVYKIKSLILEEIKVTK